MKNVLIKNSFLLFFFFFSSFSFSQSYNDLKKDTANFFLRKIDLNKDKILDVVFSSKSTSGNKLFFFINKKKVIESINFSEDGGFIIKDIIPEKKGAILKIETYFPDRGDLGAIHYIDYRNNQWVLIKTMYYINYWDKKAIECRCLVNQNMLLKKLKNSKILINGFPSEKERKKKCQFNYPKF